MRILSVLSWSINLLKGLAFFLFVWTTYLTLRKCSFNTRLKSTIFIAFLFYHVLYRRGTERIKKNIALIFPNLDKKQIDQKAWRVVKTAAHSWATMLGNEFTDLEEIAERIKAKGEVEQILSLYSNDEKIIATAVHVGPVDEMLGIISLYGVNVYAPAESTKPRWFFNLTMRLRLRFDGILIEEIKQGKTLAQAAYHLNKGRIVALEIDMTRQSGRGVICRIGEAKAKFPAGAVALALKENATIFPIFPSWQEENNKALMVVGEPFRPIRTGDLNRDIEDNTRRLIEERYAPHILKYLEQWSRLLWVDLEPAES